MASKKGYSRVGLFGDTIHYDAHGKKIGETRPGIFGGATHYDTSGKKIGTSSPNFFGGETIYDTNHKKIGSTSPGLFSTTYYDANHEKAGSSMPFFGSSTNDCDLSNKYENLCAGSHSDPLYWQSYKRREGNTTTPLDHYPNAESNDSRSDENSKSGTSTIVVSVLAIVVIGAFLLYYLMR